MSIGSHQSAKAKSVEWLTPPHIIKALGHFDLDPCSPVERPWPTASKHYTIHDDGLSKPWSGTVWCNPPYGKETGKWLKRCADHDNGIALVFARTETEMFFNYVWPSASALLFIKGRLHFHDANGVKAKDNCGGPSVLIAYGTMSAIALKGSGIPGVTVDLDKGFWTKHDSPSAFPTPPTEEDAI